MTIVAFRISYIVQLRWPEGKGGRQYSKDVETTRLGSDYCLQILGNIQRYLLTLNEGRECGLSCSHLYKFIMRNLGVPNGLVRCA